MRKSYKFKKKFKVEKRFFSNYQIRAPQVSVIDEEGNHLGTMDTLAAIHLAEERGLDLVEVSPVANPPVAKIINFGSFQYQKEKLFRKQKKQAKTVELKNLRLSLKIGEHDQETKARQAENFLKKGDKVKIELLLKGREISRQDLAREKLKEFLGQIKAPNQIEQDIMKQGNKLFIILMPQ